MSKNSQKIEVDRELLEEIRRGCHKGGDAWTIVTSLLGGYEGDLPLLTAKEFYAIREKFSEWCMIKAKYEPRWTEEQRQCLRQLHPDIGHSALLQRMILERKDPLPEPPPLSHAYPVYPED